MQDVLVPSQVASRTSERDLRRLPHRHARRQRRRVLDGAEQLLRRPRRHPQRRARASLPTYVNPTALATIRSLHGIPAYSTAHWTDGDRDRAAERHRDAALGRRSTAPPRGTLARTGDANKATRADLQPRRQQGGLRLRRPRSSTAASTTGRPISTRSRTPTAPGGAATPLPGASDPGATEYYPSFSPDDTLVAFTRLAGAGTLVQQPGRGGLRRSVQRRHRRDRDPPRRQRRRRLPDRPREPRSHQRLAQVVAARRHRRQRQDLLLAHVLVEARRHRQRPALRRRHRRRRRRRQADDATRPSTSGTSPPPTATTPRPGTTSRSRRSSSTEARLRPATSAPARPKRRGTRRPSWEA